MNTFRLIVASPDGRLFDGQAEMLTLRGAEGDLAVMAGHAPFVTTVRSGPCRVHLPGGKVRQGMPDGGLLTVDQEKTTLLCAGFSWSEQEA